MLKNIKDNSRRYFTGGGPRPDRNERKRQEAAQRLERWQSLSLKEQLAELARRPGACKRQRERITA